MLDQLKLLHNSGVISRSVVTLFICHNSPAYQDNCCHRKYCLLILILNIPLFVSVSVLDATEVTFYSYIVKCEIRMIQDVDQSFSTVPNAYQLSWNLAGTINELGACIYFVNYRSPLPGIAARC